MKQSFTDRGAAAGSASARRRRRSSRDAGGDGRRRPAADHARTAAPRATRSLGIALAGDAADRRGSAHDGRADAAAAQPEGLLFLSRGHRADLLQVARRPARRPWSPASSSRASDGRLTFGCYVYDVDKGRELARKGFVVGRNDWRRAAHKCSGLAYTAVTGAPGMFDTRIAYVAESGSRRLRTVKRIAIMDSDGFNHRYLTAGDTIVLTPRLSPKAAQRRLCQLRRRQARRCGSSTSIPAATAPAGSERRDQLRAALFARRQPHRLLDDARAQQRHLCRRRRRRACRGG